MTNNGADCLFENLCCVQIWIKCLAFVIQTRTYTHCECNAVTFLEKQNKGEGGHKGCRYVVKSAVVTFAQCAFHIFVISSDHRWCRRRCCYCLRHRFCHFYCCVCVPHCWRCHCEFDYRTSQRHSMLQTFVLILFLSSSVVMRRPAILWLHRTWRFCIHKHFIFRLCNLSDIWSVISFSVADPNLYACVRASTSIFCRFIWHTSRLKVSSVGHRFHQRLINY